MCVPYHDIKHLRIIFHCIQGPKGMRGEMGLPGEIGLPGLKVNIIYCDVSEVFGIKTIIVYSYFI